MPCSVVRRWPGGLTRPAWVEVGCGAPRVGAALAREGFDVLMWDLDSGSRHGISCGRNAARHRPPGMDPLGIDGRLAHGPPGSDLEARGAAGLLGRGAPFRRRARRRAAASGLRGGVGRIGEPPRAHCSVAPPLARSEKRPTELWVERTLLR